MKRGNIILIVVIVALLVGGFYILSKVFRPSCCGGIDELSPEVQAEINKLFEDKNRTLNIYPISQRITIKKDSDPAGFLFNIKDNDIINNFSYNISAIDNSRIKEKCGSEMSYEIANSYIVISKKVEDSDNSEGGAIQKIDDSIDDSIGSVAIENSDTYSIFFQVPKDSASCTILYKLNIYSEGEEIESESIWVTIK